MGKRRTDSRPKDKSSNVKQEFNIDDYPLEYRYARRFRELNLECLDAVTQQLRERLRMLERQKRVFENRREDLKSLLAFDTAPSDRIPDALKKAWKPKIEQEMMLVKTSLAEYENNRAELCRHLEELKLFIEKERNSMAASDKNAKKDTQPTPSTVVDSDILVAVSRMISRRLDLIDWQIEAHEAILSDIDGLIYRYKDSPEVLSNLNNRKELTKEAITRLKDAVQPLKDNMAEVNGKIEECATTRVEQPPPPKEVKKETKKSNKKGKYSKADLVNRRVGEAKVVKDEAAVKAEESAKRIEEKARLEALKARNERVKKLNDEKKEKQKSENEKLKKERDEAKRQFREQEIKKMEEENKLHSQKTSHRNTQIWEEVTDKATKDLKQVSLYEKAKKEREQREQVKKEEELKKKKEQKKPIVKQVSEDEDEDEDDEDDDDGPPALAEAAPAGPPTKQEIEHFQIHAAPIGPIPPHLPDSYCKWCGLLTDPPHLITTCRLGFAGFPIGQYRKKDHEFACRIAGVMVDEDKIDQDGLKKVVISDSLLNQFTSLTDDFTAKNLEAMGFLLASTEIDSNGEEYYRISCVYVPKQSNNTPDSCGEDPDMTEKHKLIEMGYIHTHPKHGCRLSSIDQHNQAYYEAHVREAISVVDAHMGGTLERGYFRLTYTGRQFLKTCKKSGFHEHEPFYHEEIFTSNLKNVIKTDNYKNALVNCLDGHNPLNDPIDI